MEDLLLYFKPK